MGNNAAVCYSITLYRILEGRALERLTRRKDVLKKMQKSAVLPGKTQYRSHVSSGLVRLRGAA